jgi:putative ABC transport system permease protein
MFNRETWIEIAHTVTANPLRTALTGLSVGLGIFILVVMQGLGFGLQNGVEQDFGDEARNTVWVRTGTTTLPFRGRQPNRRVQMRNEDEQRITEQVVDATAWSGRRMMWGSTVGYKSEQGNYPIVGVEPDFDDLELLPLRGGRWLHADDLAKESKVCVVGENLLEELFKRDEAIGAFVTLNGITFRVVGHFSKNGRWGNSMVYVPLTTMQRVFNGSDEVDQMVLSTGDLDLEGSTAMVGAVDADLRLRHSVHPDDQRAVRVRDNQEEFAMFERIFVGIRLFIWIIGGFTLLAGAIGVANIMAIVVKERTVEIGVRKALGATSGSILSLIVIEAISLTLISGALGLIAGVATLNVAAPYAQHDYFTNPEVNLRVTITALVVLVVAGAISGFVPALRAVRIRPIEALRYE